MRLLAAWLILVQLRLIHEVRLVVLDVSVRDQRGQPVAGLERSAFQVFDNRVRQPIAAFAREDSPVTLGLVVDCSGSMRAKRASLLAAASALAEAGNPEDEMFLVTFNDAVRVAPPAALAQTPLEGRTALYDALHTAFDQFRRGTRERKALVVLSDGGDNASQASKEDILRQAQLSQATVHAVGIQDPAQKERDPGFLRRIAFLTGGDFVDDVAPEQLAEACRQIARGIRTRYTVAFRAADTRVIEHRKIRVEVTIPSGKAKVRTRPAYVATPAVSTEVSR